MKRILICTLLAGLLLSGCSSAPSSSAAASSRQPSAGSSSAAISSSSGIETSVSESTSSSDSSSDAKRVETRQEFLSLTAQNSTQKLLLVLQVPKDWVYNGFNTFTDASGKKTLEVGAPFVVSESTAFSDERVTQFDKQNAEPGNVFLNQQEISLSEQEELSRRALIYSYEGYPADSDTPWYPSYTFIATQGYVVPLYFYQYEKQDDLSLVKQVLEESEIFISKNSAASSNTDSSGSTSAAPASPAPSSSDKNTG